MTHRAVTNRTVAHFLAVVELPFSIVGVAFLALGITLFVQPERYDRTPSYANLLDIAPQATWGAIYLAVAAVLLASVMLRRNRPLAVLAHTLSFCLVATWLLAFIIRYATDDATTIVNVVSWAVLLYLVVQSMLQLDEWVAPVKPQ